MILPSTNLLNYNIFILKLFQVYGNVQDDCCKKLMETHPILALLSYLMERGCNWDAVNSTGKKAVDLLVEKGLPKELIDILDQTAAKWKRWPIGPAGCMGLNGECVQQAVYRLSCSHRATVSACSRCFPLIFKQQHCGFADQDVESIQPEEAQQNIQEEEPNSDESQLEFSNCELKWTDGPRNGVITDQLGNTYVWTGKVRQDGGIGYKCTKQMTGFSQKKCPAMARRFVNATNGSSMILLETPHKHPTTLKRFSSTRTRGHFGTLKIF